MWLNFVDLLNIRCFGLLRPSKRDWRLMFTIDQALSEVLDNDTLAPSASSRGPQDDERLEDEQPLVPGPIDEVFGFV